MAKYFFKCPLNFLKPKMMPSKLIVLFHQHSRNPKIISLLSSSKVRGFLEKWLNRLMDYQSSCRFILCRSRNLKYSANRFSFGFFRPVDSRSDFLMCLPLSCHVSENCPLIQENLCYSCIMFWSIEASVNKEIVSSLIGKCMGSLNVSVQNRSPRKKPLPFDS